MEQAERGTHLPWAMVIEGDFRPEKVQPVFQKIADQQEALRTCYAMQDGAVVQKIYDTCEVKVELDSGIERKIPEYVQDFIQPFQLDKPPLLHIKVIQLEHEKYLLLTDIHHSIADGYSCTILSQEFMKLYEGKELVAEGKPYHAFTEWQESYKKSKQYQCDADFWRCQLGEKDLSVTIPADFKRPEKSDTEGSMLCDRIEEGELVQLKGLAKKLKCSCYHLLYGAFSLLVSKMTGKNAFTIGTPAVMRGEGGFEATIGMFTNTLVLLSKINATRKLSSYLEQVKRSFGESFEHGAFPFEDLVSLVKYYKKPNRNPVFDLMFIYENGEDRVNRIGDFTCEVYDIPQTQSFFDISFELIEENGGLSIHVYYKTSLYKMNTIKKLIGWYKELLLEMQKNPEERVETYLHSYMEEWEALRNWQDKLSLKNPLQNQVVKELEQNTKNLERNATELEKELSTYWKESLHLENIDIQENFFELGGRSIDAMNLAEQLKQVYGITVLDLFQYPTVELLAKRIAEGTEWEKGKEAESMHVQKKTQMPIAIIGMAGCFPKSEHVKEFWKNLEQGKECITFFDKEELIKEGIPEEQVNAPGYVRAKGVLENAERFDAAFFEYSPKEAEGMDPQLRIFHECAWNALEDAGYAPGSLNAGNGASQNIGVFAGSASNYTWMSHIYQPVNEVRERLERISLNDKDYLSTRISYKLNLTGPSYGIQTACSSSLVSIHLACRSLEAGECEMALAGGVSIMLPKKTGYPYEDGMILSEDGHCRVFDEHATGTVFSDGAGVIVLKPLEKAIADKDFIYAVLKGTAVNNDGSRKAGYTAPSIAGQADVITKACENAGIAPEDITYVEAHGTGTVLGDPIELAGLKQVFPMEKEPYCALGSLKSNFGHLDAAAGVAGVIKAALALKYKKIPASIQCEIPNPHMKLEESPFYIPKETRYWKKKRQDDNMDVPRRAGVSSLGFGGTNAHAVLEEVSDGIITEEVVAMRKQRLFVFSAKTKAALEKMSSEFLEFAKENPHMNPGRAAYTLQMGRSAFTHRKAVVASDIEELEACLQKEEKTGVLKCGTADREKPQVVFLFSGQGSQYVNMARNLYEKETDFRKLMDHCFDLAEYQPDSMVNYREIVFPRLGEEETSKEQLKETKNAQVILFILEYALAVYIMTKIGIRPDALIGHSLGEYAAACVAGVFSLEDGIHLVQERSKLMQSMERGGMDAIGVSEKTAGNLVKESGTKLSIAAVNGEENCVVSGAFPELEAFEKCLEGKGMGYRRLKSSHAFHSAMMEPIIEQFTEVIKDISLSKPKIPYISNYTGTWVKDEILTPDYWCSHLRSTVHFYEGVMVLAKRKSVFVEVGPGKTLSSLVKRCVKNENRKAVCNLIRHEKELADDVDYFMQNVGAIWCNGVEIDFQGLNERHVFQKLSLPGYPFMGQYFPLQVETAVQNKKRPIEEWFYRPCWKVKEDVQVKGKQDAAYVIIGNHGVMTEMLTAKIRKQGNLVTPLYYTEDWKEEFQQYVSGCTGNQIVIDLIPYLHPSIDSCFHDVVCMLQMAEKLQQVKFYMVTAKAGRGDKEDTDHLFNSLVLGVYAVAEKEYPCMSGKRLEVCEQEDIEKITDSIQEECSLEDTGSYTRYAYGLRLTPDIEPIALKMADEKSLRKNGNYVITGGLGEIARYLTDYFIDQYDANILLLAKTPLPEEVKWDEYLKKHEKDGDYRKIESLKKWKRKNVHVLVQICDICDEEKTEEAVASFEQQYGSVNGVFHIAGRKGEGLLRLKRKENAEEVLRPKVQGMQVLEKVFAKRTIEFMILFSSLVTITGEAGQSDYISANAYLDAYAEWAARQYPERLTVSVDWDNWKEIGMAHQAMQKNPDLKSYFTDGILPREGIRILETILQRKESRVMISVKDLFWYRRKLSLKRQEEYLAEAFDTDKRYERPELSSEYQPPVTETEKSAAKVWEKAFSIDKIGVQDNFFELGGDSLYAIGIANELKKWYQVDMTDIYKYPTIKQLAKVLAKDSFTLEQQLQAVKTSLGTWNDKKLRQDELKEAKEQYQERVKPYRALDLSQTKEFGTVLLLGGTGYLGIYLLRELLLQTSAKIVLIVRRNKEVRGAARIRETFCHYFEDAMYQKYEGRVQVLDGDASKEKFGLDPDVYDALSECVDCILNSSGKVDHYGEYEAFYEANVVTVKEMLTFAKKGRHKEIHQMSTKGIGTGVIPGKRHILYTEFDEDFGQNFTNYYVKTKHEAEVLLCEARKEGIDCNLYRLGDIVYNSENGHFQEKIEKNAVYLLIQSIMKLEYLPAGMPEFIEFSYVDFISKAVAGLMKSKTLTQETYHLLNPHPLWLEDFKSVLKQYNCPAKYVDLDTFFSYLTSNYGKSSQKKSIENFLTYSHLLEMPNYTEFVLTTEKTCILLEKLKLSWKKPDSQSLQKMIEYGKQVDFF